MGLDIQSSIMKSFIALAVLACVAVALADDYSYNRGLRSGYGGLKAPFNNAARQEAVDAKAEEAGAGTGTSEEEGVPGTGLEFGYKYEPYYGGYARGHGHGGRFYGNGFGHGFGHGF